MPQPPATAPDDADDVHARLAESLAPAQLPPARKGELWQRIRARLAPAAAPAGTRTWRAGGDGWIDGLPGIRLHVLRVDAAAGTQEVLVRFAPGSSVPAHAHRKEEQMVIIEGTVHVGAHPLGAGDVHVAAAGTQHEALTAPDGALLLLRCEYPFPVDG